MRLLLPLTALASASLFATAASANNFQVGKISGNEFNPAISLILDGRYTYNQDDTEFELPGYQLGGEAGFDDEGFTTGHNELSLSANVDDKFFGKFTTAIVQEDGETVVEGEEAFLETLGLGNGFTLKGGQFFSGIGYLNQQHEHAYDFVDAPLVYQAMFGGNLIDTGLQARWLAPTDFYLELGAEALNGSTFPGGESSDGASAGTIFAKTGGDFSDSSSWQFGLSRYESIFDEREAGGHAHGDDDDGADVHLEGGEVSITGVDFVYKWAPDGNPSERNFKFQAEFFQRDEEGELMLEEGPDTGSGDYDGDQSGFYLSGVYQFMPKWRVGLRYDQITSDNNVSNIVTAGISDDEFLEDTSAESPEDDLTSLALMVDYTNSEYSRLRFQVTDVDFGGHEGEPANDGRIYTVQYILSLGAHGAHKF